jgi:hypothetical protein
VHIETVLDGTRVVLSFDGSQHAQREADGAAAATVAAT